MTGGPGRSLLLTALLGIAGGPVAVVGGMVAVVGEVVARVGGPLVCVGGAGVGSPASLSNLASPAPKPEPRKIQAIG